jgi:adenylate kinase family enzyme
MLGSKPPIVLVLAGPPLSGKSSVAVSLARLMPGIHLHVDAILSSILPDSDRCLRDRLLAYEICARAIKPVLDRSLAPILDCSYSRKEFRSHVVNNVQSNDTLVVIEFRISVETALERFSRRRNHGAIDLTRELVADRAKTYPYGHGTAVVDGEKPTDQLVPEISAIIDRAQTLDRRSWVSGGV